MVKWKYKWSKLNKILDSESVEINKAIINRDWELVTYWLTRKKCTNRCLQKLLKIKTNINESSRI